MMNRSLFWTATIGLVILQAVTSVAAPKTTVVDRVVAVIDETIVLRSELMARVAPLAANVANIPDDRQKRRQLDKLTGKVLEEMVNEELMVQEAATSKLEVTKQEIDNALADIKKQNNLDDNQLAQALRMQGYTMAGYRRDLRKQILRLRVVNTVVRPRVAISDDEVRSEFDARSRNAAAVSEVRLSHILLRLPNDPSAAQVQEVQDKAKKILSEAGKGVSFSELAQNYSDDEATKNSGGELGWIERGSIATEWENVVFRMAKGAAQGPVRGPSGMHIFYVADIRQTGNQSFEDVKDQLRNEMYRKEMDRQTRLWIDELRKKAYIDVRL